MNEMLLQLRRVCVEIEKHVCGYAHNIYNGYREQYGRSEEMNQQMNKLQIWAVGILISGSVWVEEIMLV